jgi:membrane-associated HD superfamily phosphohydrolase
VILAVWFYMDPPRPIVVDSDLGRYWGCSSSDPRLHQIFNVSMLSYNGILICICLYYAFQTHSCWAVYNESQSLGLVIYITTLMTILSVDIEYYQNPSFNFLFYSRYVLLLGGTILIELILFLTRVVEASKKVGLTNTGHSGSSKSNIKLERMSEKVELMETHGFLSHFKRWTEAEIKLTTKKNLMISTPKVVSRSKSVNRVPNVVSL